MRGDVAAVIAEPARAVPFIPPRGYWQSVREACDANGTLLIFDEIPTGLGKTGRFFAAEHDGVAPDIVVLGKALGGGVLPIAACVARADLDVAGEYAFGHYTHEKNPVTAARRAGHAAGDRARSPGRERAQRSACMRWHRLREMQHRHALIGDVRGRGMLLGIELVLDRDSKAPAADAAPNE